MKKALLVLAISIVLVPAAIAQSMDVGQRQFQNRLFCGPNPAQNVVLIQKFSPNNNADFVGYMPLNVYNCASSSFDQGPGRRDNRSVEGKRRRL